MSVKTLMVKNNNKTKDENSYPLVELISSEYKTNKTKIIKMANLNIVKYQKVLVRMENEIQKTA